MARHTVRCMNTSERQRKHTRVRLFIKDNLSMYTVHDKRGDMP